MNADYSCPNTTFWDESDARVKIESFDPQVFRETNNEYTANRRTSLPAGNIAFSVCEQKAADWIGTDCDIALDIGCGNGRFLLGLLQRGTVNRGIGIDIADIMIEYSRESAANNGIDNVTFACMAIEEISGDIGQVDVVIALEVLEHLFDVRAVLGSNIKPLIRQGGLFCGSVPYLRVGDDPMHLHYFNEDSLHNLLLSFFSSVFISRVDATGKGEEHLMFLCNVYG